MAAAEALANYGFEKLLAAVEEGQAPLVPGRSEPARTIQSHRNALGYTPEELARLAKVDANDVVKAETPGQVSPIRILERLARPLAIDERILGFATQGGTEELGVRLRELAAPQGNARLTSTTVAALAESAWVIGRQTSLLSMIGERNTKSLETFQVDDDYEYPTYERGYRLAAQARQLLGLPPEPPIKSMRSLVSSMLNIPLVQTTLSENLAGATIAIGEVRGIVVNIQGRNRNVWVRRMTLAHELGHMLWDPAERLNRLTVDGYSDLTVDKYSDNSVIRRDPVEIRANAFAIAFLAPPSAVDKMVGHAEITPSAVFEVAQHFGISVTAAAAHIGNVRRVEVVPPRGSKFPEPSDEMRGQEDFTIDYFPIKGIPPALVGKFASIVAQAFREGLISRDTAATFLQTTEDNISQDIMESIINLTRR
ncbi:ImmA/IrrE family metallo-endopeptidase [Methylocystis heyeri]|uniref:ImmA/IrrE family metallo-endopeptidase n=1 Tax=Methylocystis heyeri TaxID=391905 RepID=UPI001389B882|nr:ImmA/IrrE family metallo-endopeptidase [Methylocystis heyeri]